MKKISFSGMSKSDHNIAAAILAGGENRRFGGMNKAIALLAGKKIISRMLDVIDKIFEEIIIVTNSPDDFTDFRKYLITRDHYLKKGPLGGIHAALKRTTKEAVFIFAGDMPFIDRGIILDQICYYERINRDILAPVVNNRLEPLHSIFKTSVTEKLEQYLAEQKRIAVHDFLRTMGTSFFQLEGTESTIKAFTNINATSDIGLFNNFM
jgi:molybdopterin-guanine dinucleotide biosynthesis protein A